MARTSSAIFLMVVNVLGLMLAPALVGRVSDALVPSYGDEGLRYVLMMLATANLWGAFHSLRVAKTLKADLAAAGGGDSTEEDSR